MEHASSSRRSSLDYVLVRVYISYDTRTGIIHTIVYIQSRYILLYCKKNRYEYVTYVAGRQQHVMMIDEAIESNGGMSSLQSSRLLDDLLPRRHLTQQATYTCTGTEYSTTLHTFRGPSHRDPFSTSSAILLCRLSEGSGRASKQARSVNIFLQV